jgi:predicted outer membrane repeat protein
MTNTLKTEDYVVSVSKALGKTKKETREIIKEFLNQFSNNTANGLGSAFSGVGKVEIRDVEASIKRNPKTGEPVEVEAHQKPRFTFSGKVRNTLRGIE